MDKARLNSVFISVMVVFSAGWQQSSFGQDIFQLAQTPQPASSFGQTTPPTAPSFYQQARDKIFESAQKKIIHTLNNKLQPQQGQAQGVAPAANQAAPVTVTGTSLSGAASTTRKQAAPCRSWIFPGGKPVACLLCIHGLGLQSNSYEFFANEQSKHGLSVYALDVRGFGSWINAGGKTKVDFNDCLLDIKVALESIRAANPGLPVYVLGESMGGAIALRAAADYPELVDGLISSVPAGERFNQGKTSLKVFLNLLAGKNVADVGKDIVNQATQNTKTQNVALKEHWQGDPLARLSLTPQELIQFQEFMNNNHEAAKRVSDMPVLFVQGNGDHLVKPEGTWELFNSVASEDKSFFSVPGEHLIFEEAQTQDARVRDQNFRVISAWLTAKVGRRLRGPVARIASQLTGESLPVSATNGTFSTSSPSPFRGRMPNLNTAGLERQVAMIENGQYQAAIAELEQILPQRQGDPNILVLLGRACLQSGQREKAAFYFRSAMRLDRTGHGHARALNAGLLNLNQDFQGAQSGGAGEQQVPGLQQGPALQQGFGSQQGAALQQGPALQQGLSFQSGSGLPPGMFGPAAGFLRRLNQASGGPAVSGTAGDGARPRIYAFYADWADQCRGMRDTLNQLSSRYGNRVEMTMVNIEDPSADALVDQFNVGPIPTVVFVSASGRVQSTIIGESAYNNYEQAVKAILPPLSRLP